MGGASSVRWASRSPALLARRLGPYEYDGRRCSSQMRSPNWTSASAPGGKKRRHSLSARSSGFWPVAPATIWRRESPGRSVFPTARSPSSFPRTRSSFPFCCLSPPGTGGPTRWPPLSSHFFATQQEHWPPLYALQCEVFDAVQNVLTAAGIRLFIKSPFHRITLREAIIFVLIAVIIVPVGTAFWGAAFTVSNHFGTHYWIEWRNLSISNAVTAIVLVPVILIGVHQLSAKGIKAAPAAHAGSMLSWPWAFSRSDTSPSIGRRRDRTLRPRSSMHPFPCSSGRPSALGLAA